MNRVKNLGKKLVGFGKNITKKALGIGTGIAATAGVAMAETTELTVASIDTTILYSAATVVFSGLGLITAIIIGIRVYKKL